MKLSRDIQETVRQRDAVCVYCGDPYGPYEVDHVLPRHRGGTDALVNLVLACRRCNQAKAGKGVVGFLSEMKLVRTGRKRISRSGRIVKVLDAR